MEKEQLLHILRELREKSPKRKFSQTFDLVINLQGIDIKKPEQKVDFYINLSKPTGKLKKICGLVDVQLAAQAKEHFDRVILKEEFQTWSKNKKEQKKVAEECDYFVAQAELMTHVAANFGKVFGPKGKMPNPKAGCVVPATAQLAPLVARLKTLVRVQNKNDLTIKVPIGAESQKDEDVADNILAVYNTILTKLPQDKNNVKNTSIKLTMGPLFKIEAAKRVTEDQKRKK